MEIRFSRIRMHLSISGSPGSTSCESSSTDASYSLGDAAVSSTVLVSVKSKIRHFPLIFQRSLMTRNHYVLMITYSFLLDAMVRNLSTGTGGLGHNHPALQILLVFHCSLMCVYYPFGTGADP